MSLNCLAHFRRDRAGEIVAAKRKDFSAGKSNLLLRRTGGKWSVESLRDDTDNRQQCEQRKTDPRDTSSLAASNHRLLPREHIGDHTLGAWFPIIVGTRKVHGELIVAG